MNDILEIGFTLGYNFHTSPFSFDHVDFFEYVWMFDRLAKEKEREQQTGNNSGTSLETLMR